MAENPEFLNIQDDYGGVWKLTPEDGAIWTIALGEYAQGIDPVVIPARILRNHRGWGWWTAIEGQIKWLEENGVPTPSTPSLGLQNDSESLSTALQLYGGYITYLSAIIGSLEGSQQVLKDCYSSATMIATANLDDAEKLTERAKEAKVLTVDETLRETKRKQIETEAILATARGLRDGYQAAWDTVSRLISLFASEAGLATGRHA